MKRLPLVQLLAICIMGVMSLWLIFSKPSLPDSPEMHGDAAFSVDFQYTIATSPNAIEIITGRPLFQPSRLPYIPAPELTIPLVPESALVPAAPSLLDQATLLGLAIGPGGRMGLVRLVGDFKPRIVREGDLLDGWHIDRILKDNIALSNGNIHRELHFSKNSSPPVAGN